MEKSIIEKQIKEVEKQMLEVAKNLENAKRIRNTKLFKYEQKIGARIFKKYGDTDVASKSREAMLRVQKRKLSDEYGVTYLRNQQNELKNKVNTLKSLLVKEDTKEL